MQATCRETMDEERDIERRWFNVPWLWGLPSPDGCYPVQGLFDMVQSRFHGLLQPVVSYTWNWMSKWCVMPGEMLSSPNWLR